MSFRPDASQSKTDKYCCSLCCGIEVETCTWKAVDSFDWWQSSPRFNSVQKAEGPAASPAKPSSKVKHICQIVDGKFSDYRWVDGTWNFAEFSDGKGSTDWDAVTSTHPTPPH